MEYKKIVNIQKGIIMNIKLQKIISLFNERKNFFNNHPDTYRFMLDNFGKEMPVGTEIEVIVKRPDKTAQSNKLSIEPVDKKFIDSLTDILKR